MINYMYMYMYVHVIGYVISWLNVDMKATA